MLAEHLQDRSADSLAQFCINVATDFQATPAIRERAMALSKAWMIVGSRRASAFTVKEGKLVETEEKCLQAQMAEFLAGLSDVVIQRDDPSVCNYLPAPDRQSIRG